VDDPLHLLFRLVLLRGLRRGEVVGLRWAGADLDAGYLTIWRPIIQLGGEVIESKPKSTAGPVAGKRRAWLDATSGVMVKRTGRRSWAPGCAPRRRGRTTT
jgi:integrase